MQVKEHVRGLLRMVLFLCFSLQILLGFAWVVANIGSVPKYDVSDLALEGLYNFIQSKAWLCILVYLVQLTAAFLAGRYMLRGFGISGRNNVFGALGLVTFQPALQCHMAIIPNSLMLSFSMVLLGYLLRFWNQEQKRKWWISGALCAFGALLIFLSNSGFTAEEVLVKRLGWPVMIEDYYTYPEAFRDKVEVNDLFQSLQYPDSVEERLFPLMEEKFESNERKIFYRKVLAIIVKNHAGSIVKRGVWDLLGYHVPPVVLVLQQQGRGAESMSGINYSFFTAEAPALSKVFVRMEAIILLASLVSALGLGLLAEEKKICVPKVLFMSFGLELVVMYYWIQGAGRMDYKNGLIFSMVLLSLCVKALSQRKEEEKC